MSKPKVIVQTLSQGGSANGIHSKLKWLKCPRAAQLDLEAQAKGEPDSYTHDGVLTGTLYHLYHEINDNMGFLGDAILEVCQIQPHSADKISRCQIDACRRFHDYIGLFGRHSMGRAWKTELTLPYNTAQEEKVKEVFGEVITGKIDKVVNLTPTKARALSEMRDCDIAPGWWLVDYKLISRAKQNILQSYQHSIQFGLYEELFRLCFPKRKLNGTLIDIGIKLTKTQFKILQSKPPSLTYIKDQINRANALRGATHANDAHCFSPFVCHWHANGVCDRSIYNG